jgi:hypothetical protein
VVRLRFGMGDKSSVSAGHTLGDHLVKAATDH